ncbi:MAG: Gfo/Idh/MocA family oxidoreductase, partial [Rhizobiales bacterium]|nr:Gfo/Idh/MocA family oxidoreductase [Hyphomicrobiales bacterium]
EVDAVIVATSNFAHVEPTLAAVERGAALLIEKPLATDARESANVLAAIQKAKVDAVLGYTQRFRRRFLVVKQKIENGQIGDLTAAVVRTFINRMVPLGETRLTQDRRFLTPMVVSGTHSLDMSMWLMGGAQPTSVFARANDRVLGEMGTKDATFGVFQMDNGAIWSMNVCWSLPEVWPGAVYGIEIGLVGTTGVIDIEDTHRDLVLAGEFSQGPGYNPDGLKVKTQRNVEFLTSFPPGDLYGGELWGPMREETNSWFNRIYLGKKTPHATAEDGHRNLMLTMAMDLSAKRKKEVQLPIDPAELMAGLEE